MATNLSRYPFALALAFFGANAGPLGAQCLDWSREFGRADGFDNTVRAIAQFDDGSGPAIYVGGEFGFVDGINVGGLAKRTGSTWAPVGEPLNGNVNSIAVFDDGGGPALYIGGVFGIGGATYIAKWDGSTWSALGSGLDGPPSAMVVHDDGSGPALFVCGLFTMAGGNGALRVAKWNGSTWSALGNGLSNGGPGSGTAYALAVFDDGAGPKLYAGGSFQTSGASTIQGVARWNGVSWSALGTGTNSDVNALAAFDSGSGPALYAAGTFITAGGVPASRIAKWNGTSWSALGSGLNAVASALCVYDDGGGPRLYVGGKFTSAGGVSADRIASWSAGGWSTLSHGFDKDVLALSAVDVGAGPQLCAGGSFLHITGAVAPEPSYAPRFSTWNGAAWSTTVAEGKGASNEVDCMLVHDDGSGPSLFAGGAFTSAGGVACNYIGRWDGAHWWPVGGGLSASCYAMAVFDDGSGPALFAGGGFASAGGNVVNYVAKWDGAQWSGLGGGMNSFVRALAVYDDGSGPALYAAGEFFQVEGVTRRYIAKWDGASWSSLGNGLAYHAKALVVHDDGSGSALFVAGYFNSYLGGPVSPCVAKWNGSSWSSLGSGMSGPGIEEAFAITTFDDGTGVALYVAGGFQNAGGVVVNNVAKWNGSAWSSLGTGVDDTVWALATHDDGSGTALYAGGWHHVAGGVTAPRVAKWDGANWSALYEGSTGSIARALGVFDEGYGAGPDLYVGGRFDDFGGFAAANVTRWGACRPGSAYCFGDDVDALVTTDCPCGNFGSSGHGCAHSSSMRGARLDATGTTTPNTIVFTATELPNNTLCTFLAGNHDVAAGFVFGDGVRCTNVPILRFGQQNSGQGGNAPFTAAAATMTQPAGVTRYYQCQYRNPTAGYCDPGLFNLSNGYRVTW